MFVLFFGLGAAGFMFSFLCHEHTLGSFCVHSYMHAGTHSAFWMCLFVCVSVLFVLVLQRACVVVFNVYIFYDSVHRNWGVDCNIIILYLKSFVLESDSFEWKMLHGVIVFLFLFQTRPQRMGRARMKCCGGVMGTKRWESNVRKLLLSK